MRTSAVSGRRRKPNRARLDSRVVAALMVGGSVLVLSLVLWAGWATSHPTRAVEPAVAAVNAGALLPLAAPVNPIVGVHDMNNMPDFENAHAQSVAGIPQANVDLPLENWDWGAIPARPPVVQTFPIQNTGDKSLLITNVVTSCGCTVAALSSSVIPPGQRADLKVTFDPDFHATQGPVTRLVWLETNDPDMPIVELRLDADVQG